MPFTSWRLDLQLRQPLVQPHVRPLWDSIVVLKPAKWYHVKMKPPTLETSRTARTLFRMRFFACKVNSSMTTPLGSFKDCKRFDPLQHSNMRPKPQGYLNLSWWLLLRVPSKGPKLSDSSPATVKTTNSGDVLQILNKLSIVAGPPDWNLENIWGQMWGSGHL